MMKPAEFGAYISGDNKAKAVANLWDKFNRERQPILAEWAEQRNYVFATDSSTTSQGGNGWNNTTTIPKLAQIRDNLHSNYMAALFPNDDWLRWEAYSADAAKRSKASAIEAYMANKTRVGGFKKTISKLVYDYIDYGIAIGTPTFEARYKMIGESEIPDFIGPKAVRISPQDIVFNPTAKSFRDTWKIVRTIKTLGELRIMSEEQPDDQYLASVIDKMTKTRGYLAQYGLEDQYKNEAYNVDGFGNLQTYYESGYVEVLEFWGDWHDQETGVLKKNQVITVVDRSQVLREADIPTWLGHIPIYAAGWRERPDNLWPMGPLANLVGMQYRMDHLENSKADAYDLAIAPPIAIIGEVEDFNWGPGCEVHIESGGSVQEIQKNIQWALSADTGIDRLEQRMEEFAGAPRSAMGIRTPGEKTAFEVQSLDNSSGRIFQEKASNFEIELSEPLLNSMLEVARRNLDTNDVVSVMDTDLGISEFITITKEDITANGVLRPVGARHFAAQAQLLQNLTGVLNGPLGALVAPHLSGKQLALVVEDVLGLERRSLFSPNVQIFEGQETQRLAAQAQEDLAAEDAVQPEVMVE